jgi:GT2 family glycosyltransferase
LHRGSDMTVERPCRVLVSILNWNHADNTEACLRSLQRAGYLNQDGIDVVVTDNGSRTEDAERAAQAAQSYRVQFRRNDQNLGFAGGHNMLLQQALHEAVPFVWLVNNDCVVEPGTLEALLATMDEQPRCAVASPCLAYEDTREVYFAGAVQDWAAMRPRWCDTPWDEVFHDQWREQVWAVGTAVLFRVEALAVVGLLNAELFAYYEDDDLGERLVRAGWRCTMLKDCVVLHNRKSEIDKPRPAYFYYLTARNWLWFYRYYTPADYRRNLTLRLLATGVDRAATLQRAGQAERSNALLLGLWDGFCSRLGRPQLDRTVPWHARGIASALRAINWVHAALRHSTKSEASR